MWQQLLPALRMTALMTVLSGLIYPLAVTAVAQLLFSGQANGSLIRRDGRVVGSSLIGQSFVKPVYFHPRPSAAGSGGYDATASGGSNLGPTSQKLADRVKASVEHFRGENPGYTGPVPSDLLTTSASGLDPHISPASAGAQVARVAHARNLPASQVQRLVAAHTEQPDLGLLGEPRVNVLLLHLALDQQAAVKR